MSGLSSRCMKLLLGVMPRYKRYVKKSAAKNSNVPLCRNSLVCRRFLLHVLYSLLSILCSSVIVSSLLDKYKINYDSVVLYGTVTETAESQYTQSEEHSNKLKQLLLKAKKDLADAKKLVWSFAAAFCNMLQYCTVIQCTMCHTL